MNISSPQLLLGVLGVGIDRPARLELARGLVAAHQLGEAGRGRAGGGHGDPGAAAGEVRALQGEAGVGPPLPGRGVEVLPAGGRGLGAARLALVGDGADVGQGVGERPAGEVVQHVLDSGVELARHFELCGLDRCPNFSVKMLSTKSGELSLIL